MVSIARILALVVAPLAGAVCIASSSFDAPPLPLAPAARWSLDVEPESCALARTFGSGPSQIVLQLEVFKPTDTPLITLIGSPIDQYKTTSPLDLRFLPDGQPSHVEPVAIRRIHVASNGQPVTAILLYADFAGRKLQRQWQEFPVLPEADLSRIDAMSVDLGGGASYQLQLGSMLAPVKALRGCVDAMV